MKPRRHKNFIFETRVEAGTPEAQSRQDYRAPNPPTARDILRNPTPTWAPEAQPVLPSFEGVLENAVESPRLGELLRDTLALPRGTEVLCWGHPTAWRRRYADSKDSMQIWYRDACFYLYRNITGVYGYRTENGALQPFDVIAAELASWVREHRERSRRYDASTQEQLLEQTVQSPNLESRLSVVLSIRTLSRIPSLGGGRNGGLPLWETTFDNTERLELNYAGRTFTLLRQPSSQQGYQFVLPRRDNLMPISTASVAHSLRAWFADCQRGTGGAITSGRLVPDTYWAPVGGLLGGVTPPRTARASRRENT